MHSIGCCTSELISATVARLRKALRNAWTLQMWIWMKWKVCKMYVLKVMTIAGEPRHFLV